MKRNILFLLAILLLHITSFAQSDSLQKQINEQVWKPFTKSFSSEDQESFKAIHSKNVTRVIQDDERVLDYSGYFKPIPDSIKAKWKNWKRNIELRFTQRIAGNGKAFEVGYYKTTSTNISTAEKRVSYGKFHVLLQKEKGVWKILMDADAHEKTDESIFKTGKPIE
jgi:ketosteroid isomerase-like protein